VAVAETQETTEAHDGVSDLAGDLVDHQVIYFSDLGAL
jgi:hypothetical protein